MPLPTEEDLRAFAERGYAVIPDVVPRHLLDAATQVVDALIDRQSPPVDRGGSHFCWRDPLEPFDPLLRPLTDSPAQACAAAMVSPLRLERPRQVQVPLSIPPYPHQPGGPHLDGPVR